MSSTDTNNHYEIVIIGAGFSGVYQLYRLRDLASACIW